MTNQLGMTIVKFQRAFKCLHFKLAAYSIDPWANLSGTKDSDNEISDSDSEIGSLLNRSMSKSFRHQGQWQWNLTVEIVEVKTYMKIYIYIRWNLHQVKAYMKIYIFQAPRTVTMKSVTVIVKSAAYSIDPWANLSGTKDSDNEISDSDSKIGSLLNRSMSKSFRHQGQWQWNLTVEIVEVKTYMKIYVYIRWNLHQVKTYMKIYIFQAPRTVTMKSVTVIVKSAAYSIDPWANLSGTKDSDNEIWLLKLLKWKPTWKSTSTSGETYIK